MSQTTLEDLVNEERFTDDNLLGVILYFPVGIVLVVIRLIIGILVWLTSAILPEISSIRIFITNFTCFTLGICVRSQGQRDDKTTLLISNCVSIFDPLALHVATLCISPSKWDLPPPLAWALGIRHMGSPSSNESREAIKKRIADLLDAQLAVQPEDCPTSGKGVLKFSKWPFMLYDKVQPVTIEVNRWFGNVTTASLSHWSCEGFAWSDLFWFLWSPYTVFTIHLLPAVERIDKETPEEFASRVQKIIADFLKVEATPYSAAEVRSLVASREAGPAPTQGSAGPMFQGRPDLRRMAAQVKEVLPSVPLAVIIKDLGRTRSVDVTLSNILEGTIPYTPEENPPVAPKAPHCQGQTSHGPAPVSTAASTFPRTAQDRQLSFQERKAQLVQEARRRYCQKNGLTHLL